MCLTVKFSLQSVFLFPNYLAIFFSYLLIFVLFALQSGFLFHTYLTIFFLLILFYAKDNYLNYLLIPEEKLVTILLPI